MTAVLKQIDKIEQWIRDHPNSGPEAHSEMIRRLRELNEQINQENNESSNQTTETGR